MFERFITWIKALFGRTPVYRRDGTRAAESEAEYKRIDDINFAALIAHKLANIGVSDATLNITDASGGESKRSILISGALERVFDKCNKITSQVLGSGGRVFIPYVANGRMHCDIVAQDRMIINEIDGDRIISATILADIQKFDTLRYFRWTDYTLDIASGIEVIRNRATSDSGAVVPLNTIGAWADISDEIQIANVDRLTFVVMRCPIDNRQDKDVYGVPITYGSASIIREIKDHLRVIAREYKLTRPMLGLDSALWKRRSQGDTSPGIADVRKTVQDSDDPFIPTDNALGDVNTPWLIYAPPIRDVAMYNRLDRLFELLENSVGVSRGILTARVTSTATATEIRAANHDTFTVVSAVRKQWERVIDDLAYAFDVYAEAFGLSPAGARGDYSIAFDWDMALFESSAETFAQLSELQSRNMVSKAELRQWVRGGTLEDAQAAIDTIPDDGNDAINRILNAAGSDG